MLYAANRKSDFESRRRSKNPLVKPLEKGCNFKHRATRFLLFQNQLYMVHRLKGEQVP